MNKQAEALVKRWRAKRPGLLKELERYRKYGLEASRKELFAQLAYCICTPVTNYERCDAALRELKARNLFFKPPAKLLPEVIAVILQKNRVRFHNVKGQRMAQARRRFYDPGRETDMRTLVNNLLSMEPRLARHTLRHLRVNGLGMKECSHFLRDLGHGDTLTILDRPIMERLLEFGVIKEPPRYLYSSATQYRVVESAMDKWCHELGIPLAEMDSLL
ncbi:MAG: hypothetical protein EXR47_06100 [Dehalococcoidia bacterium]|nr:hypothetical protein [Dehalococcoidia bacterium]